MQEESTTLYFTQGSSDKVYQAQLTQAPEGWSVHFQYGRRGKPLTQGTKTPTPVAYEQAKKAYDALVRSKTSKGYTPEETGAVYALTAHAGDLTAFQPQLLNPIGTQDLQALLQAWGTVGTQYKHDGERRGVLAIDNKPIGANRKGLRVALLDRVEQALNSLMQRFGTTLDTEDMGSHLVVFDVLTWEGISIMDHPFYDRAQHLEAIADYVQENGLDDVLIVDIPIWHTTIESLQAYVQEARNTNQEGIVLRDPTAPYTAGRPASGGSARKLKFVETATVRVKSQHPTKRSIGLEILDKETWVAVGNVTVPTNYALPTQGALVEVSYLYAYEGGSLYQPVYKGERTDLDATQASIAQLKYK